MSFCGTEEIILLLLTSLITAASLIVLILNAPMISLLNTQEKDSHSHRVVFSDSLGRHQSLLICHPPYCKLMRDQPDSLELLVNIPG